MQVTLPAIAFGGSARACPIPAAPDPWATWFRAVALGGAGRYAAAAGELGRLDVAGADDVLRSFALSTRAAHRRQAGRHHHAVADDAQALLLAAGRRRADPTPVVEERRTAALCDALTGLAADNLGRGMFGASGRLLDRVDQILDAQGRESDRNWIWGGRTELRSHWVRAELAMFTGDAAEAGRHARAAEAMSAACPSIRHVIKTDLIAAAAAATAGDVRQAGARASRVTDQAIEFGQLPLEWAAAKLLDGIGAGEQWSGRAQQLGAQLKLQGAAMD
ncbi:hypothetical protein [Williamsia sp. 1135]|uniref:hypothetical protein n=1 Tax=Williamsia sp. 1135 TaxID=1889262 RepID=UPI000A102FDA|nr:hypothetical protein [Williamsia sp. 1135]ORM25898.1 hypothetical protein BFL43_23445 [Williamsia sp. 1135]